MRIEGADFGLAALQRGADRILDRRILGVECDDGFALPLLKASI
jgi:hypothetical protein